MEESFILYDSNMKLVSFLWLKHKIGLLFMTQTYNWSVFCDSTWCLYTIFFHKNVPVDLDP